MAKIQLTNLQRSHQLDTSQLDRVVGGYIHSQMLQLSKQMEAFKDPNRPLGAVTTAINQSNLPQEQKQDALVFLWVNPDATIQVVAPV